MNIYTLLYRRQVTDKLYCIAQGNRPNVLWQSMWEDNLRHMNLCIWGFPLLCNTPGSLKINHAAAVCSLSSVQIFAAPWTAAHQAPLSMGFSRQDYWSGLPFPSLGDLPDAGIKLIISCIGRQILYHWATWEALNQLHSNKIKILKKGKEI